METSNILTRKIGLVQATAINMIDMVGVGPFVVIGSVAAIMGGNAFVYAWLAGAFLSLIDGMAWAQLGATYPLAGGSYHFLKEGFGKKWGALFSFLFVWQTCFQAPLVIASAAIGFSQYFGYLHPLDVWQTKAMSGSVVLAIAVMLYRDIGDIGKISVFLWIGVLATMAWIVYSGVSHGNFMAPILLANKGTTFNAAFGLALGAAGVKTMYSYLGYYNVCQLGGEIKNPARNIPKSIFFSIVGIAILYLAMNISVASQLPFSEMVGNDHVVSTFMEKTEGKTVARVVTGMILWVAFASVFSATLGYSRVPYAAAKDGSFFKVFGRLHPEKGFPHVSLLVLSAIAFCFSLLFKLTDVIHAILAVRILVQFIGQSVGLLLLAKRKGLAGFAWKMPFFPLPVLLSIGLWSFVFFSTGREMMLGGLAVIVSGYFVYLLKQKFAPSTL